MSEWPTWLPDLILLDTYGGSWEWYEDEIYSIFYRDFIESSPVFEDRSVGIARQLIRGKEGTFWHCITEGDVEAERTPDLRRCERIAWIRPLIEHADDSSVRQWCNHRGRKVRRLLWLELAEYLLVLEYRRTHWMLWTTYCTTREHTKRKLRKEYETAKRKPTPPL